jgi:hypothetical protein
VRIVRMRGNAVIDVLGGHVGMQKVSCDPPVNTLK